MGGDGYEIVDELLFMQASKESNKIGNVRI